MRDFVEAHASLERGNTIDAGEDPPWLTGTEPMFTPTMRLDAYAEARQTAKRMVSLTV